MKTIFVTVLLLLAGAWGIAQDKLQVESLIQEGIKLHDADKFADAIAKYDEVLRIDPANRLVHYEKALSYLSLEKFEEAKSSARVLLDEGTEDILMEQAWALIGNTLHREGKPEEAHAYLARGTEKFPGSYLLWYHYATSFTKRGDFPGAEEAVLRSLMLNPEYAAAHWVLAYTLAEQQKKSQALLAAYYFLLLEPTSYRSPFAYDLIQKTYGAGVSKEGGKKINIFVTPPSGPDTSFTVPDFSLGMIAALQLSGKGSKGKKKTETAKFTEMTDSFLSIVSETKKENKGFFWEFYVRIFSAMEEKELTAPFCYFVSQSVEEKEVTKWAEDHGDHIREFLAWRKKLLEDSKRYLPE